MELNQILNDMAGANPASDNCDYGCSCGPENYGYYPNYSSAPAANTSPALFGNGNNSILWILVLLLLSGNGFGGILSGKSNNSWFILILILLSSNRGLY